MTISLDILNQCIAILKADARFDSVKAFIRGAELAIPEDATPNCELVIISHDKIREYTGGRATYRYGVELTFFARYQDTDQVTDRVIATPSYTGSATYIDNAKDLFLSYRNLDNLSGSNWVVDKIEIGNKTYGFSKAERVSNVDNFGSIVVNVEVTESH